MPHRRRTPPYPMAGYLYVLHLNPPDLAWEYLRRHPDYRRDWQRTRLRDQAALHWGLHVLEDPQLDARDAHPSWKSGEGTELQLHPDLDQATEAERVERFDVWSLPGHKQLLLEAGWLRLRLQWAGGGATVLVAPGLAAGMAYTRGVRAHLRAPQAAQMLRRLDGPPPAGLARLRPPINAMRELQTLQALDATLAGASRRVVAELLFGPRTVARDWHTDGALRAHVRRLVGRGRQLMQAGYRRLARLPLPGKGRSVPP